tara:strand:- start:3508 stop:4215 length:708 start_codon:yes stop_codon:yes gene_type:complete
MKNKNNNEIYFSLNNDKISICLFDTITGEIKKHCKFKLPGDFENNLNLNILSSLLSNNIKKLERDNGIFLNDGIVLVNSFSLETIQVCYKSIFDKKKIFLSDLPIIIKGGVKEFINNTTEHEILHILINKYIVNDKEYSIFPKNISASEIVLEVDYLCLKKKFHSKVLNLFKASKIEVKQIVSSEYSKSFYSKFDISECVSARKAVNYVNTSEVKIIKNSAKNQSLYNKVFNLFD